MPVERPVGAGRLKELEYIQSVFDRFVDTSDLPEEIPKAVMGFDFGDKQWNGTVHYLIHVVTDKDIRAKDPEHDKIMRAKLRCMIGELV